ncbi:MAG: hypothetical protein M0Q41_10805 [Bacteroidales bacterium]|nr:hypothetical protein [Acholeplasmataceae bacterium]MCK9449451.1 hypothetical protein [Bacteroidales bacterium]
MEDWKIRFVKEYQELKDRHIKLSNMIEKYHARTLEFLPTCPIELFERQRDVMQEYLSILETRAEIEKVSLD